MDPIFGPGDRHAEVVNDVDAVTVNVGDVPLNFWVGAGDFNGDGLGDVVLCYPLQLPQKRIVRILTGPLPATGAFSQRNDPRISFSAVAFSLAVGDINGDGLDDVAIGYFSSTEPNGRVDIVLGRTAAWPGLDLATQDPDIRILGPANGQLGASLALGDFNGDGWKDLAMGAPGSSTTYLLLGNSGLEGLAVDLTAGSPWPVFFKAGGLGETLFASNFNRDGKDDLVLGSPRSGPRGVIHVVFGKSEFAATQDLDMDRSDIEVWGEESFHRIVPVAGGDLTGDGRDELLFRKPGDNFLDLKPYALDGELIAGSGGVLDLKQGLPESVTAVPVTLLNMTQNQISALTDFDGDGAADLFLFKPQDTLYYPVGFLTTMIKPGGIALPTPPTTMWAVSTAWMAGADLDRDGFGDLILFEGYSGIRLFPPYGTLRVYYGCRPLTNPRIHVNSRPAPTARASLSMGVEGSPTRMMLTGDILDTHAGQWISYSPETEVTWTPSEGTKRVGVRFQNALGWTSPLVETTAALTLEREGLVVGTNRLRGGALAAFDLHVDGPCRVRAGILDVGGAELRVLFDQPVERGVLSLGWDGTNAAGRRVARGTYYLVVEYNGRRTKNKILVE